MALTGAEIIHQNIPNRLVLQDGGTVSREEWGCDVVVARYRVKTSLIEALLPRWGASHDIWRQLKKVSHRFSSQKGAMTDLECTYRGLVDGRLPEVKVTSSQAIGSAQLTILSDNPEEQGPSVEIEFYAPQTSYEYFSWEEIKTPQYKGRIRLKSTSFEVISRRGAYGAIGIFPGDTLQTAYTEAGFVAQSGIQSQGIVGVEGDFNGVAEVQTAELKSEPIALGLWKNTEVNRVQILPIGFAYYFDLSIQESS